MENKKPSCACDVPAWWLDPTPEMLNGDPLFEAIWQCIKTWDVNVPEVYAGYCGATGNHVRAILDAVRSALDAAEQRGAARGLEDGAALIAAERRRQVEAEGWTPEHDDAHNDFEMSMAAYSYIQRAWAGPSVKMLRPPSSWPWEREGWKPSDDPIRNLVKAGALIASEIDRMKRLPSPPQAASSTEEGA